MVLVCNLNVGVSNLITNTQLIYHTIVDPNIVNSRGIFVEDSNMWIISNDTGLIAHYSDDGNVQYIQLADESGKIISPTIAPIGIIENKGGGFFISHNGIRDRSILLIASEQGHVFGYNPKINYSLAIRIHNGSTDAVYTGLALGNYNKLYLANFNNAKIDVLDGNNNTLSTSITPSNLETYTDGDQTGIFSPFNIINICGTIFILYAQKKNNNDTGIGGYIDIFDGYNFTRFVNIDNTFLNSPTTMIHVSSKYCRDKYVYLIGNFGDGKINIINRNGLQIGQVMNNEYPLIIPGLSSLFTEFKRIYFTSSPNNESLVGYLKF
jgi:uncharacterized protein (TIGR03118 family)